MRETAATKASRYLVEGRLVVTAVQQGKVTSSCRGDGHIWLQAYSNGVWRCTCPVVTDQCSHLLALRRVVAVDLEDHR
jgi:hypothetical protein